MKIVARKKIKPKKKIRKNLWQEQIDSNNQPKHVDAVALQSAFCIEIVSYYKYHFRIINVPTLLLYIYVS